ncbi:MAG: DHH family phosphoesterase [Oligoflexales bacterium]|nr:DHH family phosphoesterase [Oligoflexales bacterium]
MGHKYKHWNALSQESPQNFTNLRNIIYANRQFSSVSKLDYGDYGLEAALEAIALAIQSNKRIALYADYDVDGTMSCVSWIWFLRAIGYHNFFHYIPDRFKEGYGVNLPAIQHLVRDRKAELIITMDTGITANEEARWCREQGVLFICTDHHKIQAEKMPDCIILNPKLHPHPDYQELCGCGITFVLLRKLGKIFNPPTAIWTDLLALAGMATLCDVVPLTGVNHKLTQQGVYALTQSQRPVLKKLLRASSLEQHVDEKDIGFRLGPRINAVGRLDHADKVIDAFIGEDDSAADILISYMGVCNEKRKLIQAEIVTEAQAQALAYPDDPILFLGSEAWHQGVVGIAASKIAERFWKPVWLFQKQKGSGIGKGSARSIPGFDVTDAMSSVRELFLKFGGHSAAGGFSFPLENEELLRRKIGEFAGELRAQKPELWDSVISYDCPLPLDLARLELTEELHSLKPFGHRFMEPMFLISSRITSVKFYKDKVTGQNKHTAVEVEGSGGSKHKIMFFNEVHDSLQRGLEADFLVTATQNHWQGQRSLSLLGSDYSLQ